MIRSSHHRSGFTLLEVLLASAIAVLLLGALYFALDLTLQQADAGRQAVAGDNLARGVFRRMDRDLTMTLGPLPPKSGGNNAGEPPDGATETLDEATTDTSAAGSDEAAADDAGTETAALAADALFQAGIYGTDRQLTVFVSHVPDVLAALAPLGPSNDPDVQSPSGLRRVTYWLADGGSGGLCRQVRVWVTADGVRDSVDPDFSYEQGDIIAESVVDLAFEYFDGAQWATSWDGSVFGPDGVTPIGPPRAVRVTLWLEFPARRLGDAPTQQVATHVIPVRAAPGLTTLEFVDPEYDTESVETEGTEP